jgi:hypothetical protein
VVEASLARAQMMSDTSSGRGAPAERTRDAGRVSSGIAYYFPQLCPVPLTAVTARAGRVGVTSPSPY